MIIVTSAPFLGSALAGCIVSTSHKSQKEYIYAMVERAKNQGKAEEMLNIKIPLKKVSHFSFISCLFLTR